MSRSARVSIGLIIAAGAISALLSLPSRAIAPSQWLTFIVMAVLATFAQLYNVESHQHVAYHTSPVFVFAGLLLLEPALYTALILIYLGFEWGKERIQKTQRLQAWYIQSSNIAVDLLAGLAARLVYTTLGHVLADWHGFVPMLIGILAAFSFVMMNHLLLSVILMLARGLRWHETGMLTLDSIGSELILLLLGYVVAVLWQINPWLILPALSPIILMYRALRVPGLEAEAQSDSKTSLLNARYLERRFKEEFARAERFNRPISYIMADVDFLRDINNTYGHMAGDRVISGIGDTISAHIREYDIAGRFGGEEFCIIMLEAGPEEAAQLAERIRHAVEQTPFRIDNHSEPLRTTMSFGVASYPQHARSEKELLHQADLAVYRAKAAGRNQISVATVAELDRIEVAEVDA